MNVLHVIVEVPDRCLSPNGRCHWAAKSKATKRAREAARLYALDALDGQDPPLWEAASINARAYWPDKRSRWDSDNFWAAMKATRDGLADAGVVTNDRAFRIGTADLDNYDKDFPRVELILLRN